MATWVVAYQALLLIAMALALFIIYEGITHGKKKRGVTPLLILVAGSFIYITAKILVSLVRGTPTVFVITRFNVAGTGLATIGFVLLAVEYTGLKNLVSKRTGALLLIEPAIANSLIWIDLEYFWIPLGPDSSTLSGYSWELTNIAIANQLYMGILLITGLVLLVRFWLQSAKAYQKQVGALFFAGVLPLIANLSYYFDYVRVNPTPVVFILSGFIITWAILWAGFLDLVPIGRRTVVDNLEAGVLIIDRDHRLIDINPHGRRLTGSDAEDPLVGQHIDDVLASQSSLRELYWSVTDLTGSEEFEIQIDGRYFGVTVNRLIETDDTVLGCSLVVRDITEQKIREQTLERKNDRLERFASVVSHDIRNPLNVIQGRVEIAQNQNDIETQLDTIAANADRIEEIIEDLLTLTRENEKQPIEPVNLSVAAQNAWEHIDTQNSTLETDCDASIRATPGRLTQLLENLFRNAIEHGDGNPTVRIGTVLDDESTVCGFFVADDGPGIQINDRDVIFEDGFTTHQSGTGLGLSIVASIVDSHGWTIQVSESDRGGARFEITLGSAAATSTADRANQLSENEGNTLSSDD